MAVCGRPQNIEKLTKVYHHTALFHLLPAFGTFLNEPLNRLIKCDGVNAFKQN